jgi:alpha-D-ribose 1-methylphosphonate 5-triphosphate synthase subunit PhnI
MAYVAVSGGREAVERSIALLEKRRTEGSADLELEALEKRMGLLIDRIMGEAGFYAPRYAALALKQSEGSPEEAVFLLRAYRSTLSRSYRSLPLDGADMNISRRISAAFKDIPGGQFLGATYDYTHRLLNFDLEQETPETVAVLREKWAARGTELPMGTELPAGTKLMAAGTVLPVGTELSAGTALATMGTELPVGTELPAGTTLMAVGSELPVGTTLMAAGTELPAGTKLMAAGTELPVETELPAAGTELPAGTKLMAAGTVLPMGTELSAGTALPTMGTVLPAGTELPAETLRAPRVSEILRAEGLLAARRDTGHETPGSPLGDEEIQDIAQNPLAFPAPRSARLQALARADSGFISGLAYAGIRGFGPSHPTVGELRCGTLDLIIPHPLVKGECLFAGAIVVTDVEALFPEEEARAKKEEGQDPLKILESGQGDKADRSEHSLTLGAGYGMVFGRNDTKAIAMSILDYTLSLSDAAGTDSPAGNAGASILQNQEFVLLHGDSLEMNGFISHLKLPHYVTFQSSLDRVRHTRSVSRGETGGHDDRL